MTHDDLTSSRRRCKAVKVGHSLHDGARRLVDGMGDRSLQSGVFYASTATAITGPVVDQADIVAVFANPTVQDNAREAIHRFTA